MNWIKHLKLLSIQKEEGKKSICQYYFYITKLTSNFFFFFGHIRSYSRIYSNLDINHKSWICYFFLAWLSVSSSIIWKLVEVQLVVLCSYLCAQCYKDSIFPVVQRVSLSKSSRNLFKLTFCFEEAILKIPFVVRWHWGA